MRALSVVVSSHDIDEVHRLADHVVLLNHGAVLLDEDTEQLLARHRRVEVLLPPDFGALPDFPSGWIAAESSGRVLRFTETGYQPENLSQSLASLFPGSAPADIHPLSLRELFVTLVRAGKADAGI
ncbi:MAG: hypothetical protein EOP85_11190 [Verrucomicrobiaceae bacterium]|nr:MAG: hypothetical protein EOP85_11190 [Verrucomicrobiaceae bacterium]